jgi:hypothetical protein
MDWDGLLAVVRGVNEAARDLEAINTKTQAEFRPREKHLDAHRSNTTMTRNNTPYLLRRLARKRPRSGSNPGAADAPVRRG